MRVLLTGASGLIGRAIAVDLATERNARLGLVARREHRLTELAAEIESLGGSALPVPADLTATGSIATTVDAVASQLGGLDALVHCAGNFGYAPIQDAELDQWDDVLDVNLRAAFHLAHHALPHLRQNPTSSMVFIGSVAGKDSFAMAGAYSASKFGLVGFSGSVFEDVRALGVKVCTISTGQVGSRVDVFPLETSVAVPPADVARVVRFVFDFPATSCPTEIILRPQHRLG